MAIESFVRKGLYQDSVKLMLLSEQLSAIEGVVRAVALMGSQLNKELLAAQHLLLPQIGDVTPHDLVVVVEAREPGIARTALERAAALLGQREATRPTLGEFYAVRSLETALYLLPKANIAAISVPGPYAKAEALKALRKGLHVFLFSGDVSLEAERELKDLARQERLLVMGPDCGSAIIQGIGFGFANVVKKGNVGIVGATGTGIQEVICLLDHMGIGISHAIGTGGRDMTSEIGGATMLAGIRALQEDEATHVILLIAKSVCAEVARQVLETVTSFGKPVVFCFLDDRSQLVEDSGAIPARTLEEAALRSAQLTQRSFVFPESDAKEVGDTVKREAALLEPNQTCVSGLYCGGTLAAEAALIFRGLSESSSISCEAGHRFLDLGKEDFTRGRPHPIIDPRIRQQMVRQEINQPEVAVLLVDVILGQGAHPDPAGAFLSSLEIAHQEIRQRGRHVAVVASVLGTYQDPQGYITQVQKLESAGVIVAPSNAQAVRMAAAIAN